MNYYITSALLAFVPALCWLFLYYHQDYKDKEPKKIIIQLFLAGMMMALPFVLLRYLIVYLAIGSLLIQGLFSIIIFAAMEEISKLFAAVYVINRHQVEFNQVVDGIIYAVSAALGFAFIENLFYLIDFGAFGLSYGTFLSVVIFRSLGTMLAHTLFSGFAGLIWAYAYFSKNITPYRKKHLLSFQLDDWLNHEMLSLHIIRQNILKARPSRRGGHEQKVLVLEGLMLSIFLHVIFNLLNTFDLLGQSLTFLLVPLLMGGLSYLFYLFTKKYNTRILKVV